MTVFVSSTPTPFLINQPITAGQSSFVNSTLAAVIQRGQWIIPSGYTTNAEMRRVTNVQGGQITVAAQFNKNHEVGSKVIIESGKPDVKFWGAVGDGITPDTASIQAAVDDTAGNLYFSDGIYLFDDIVRMPFVPVFQTVAAQKIVTGDINAVLTTKTFNGPFFRPLSDSGTHDGSNNAPTLADSTKSWSVNEWVDGWVFNLTDGSYGKILSNTATTITATLKQGAENDWDSADEYEIVLPTSWFNFKNLTALDQTNTHPTLGTAHFLPWLFYRTAVRFCRFSNFLHCIQSNDVTDSTEAIQSMEIFHNKADSCKSLIRVSKAWDPLIDRNQCDSVGEPMYFIGTSSPPAIVNGKITHNLIQGAGPSNQSAIRIAGAHTLELSGLYVENQGSIDPAHPIVDLNPHISRSITIGPNNRFALSTGQESDRDYFPLRINQFSKGVTVFSNESSGSLMEYEAQGLGNGEGWNVYGNYALAELPHSQSMTIQDGKIVMRRTGYVQTTSATPTNVIFGDSAPLLNYAEIKKGSVVRVRATITATRTNRAERAHYEIVAVFYQDGSQVIVQEGSTQPVQPDIVSAGASGWSHAFVLTNATANFTAAPSTLTSASHGLLLGNRIYLTTTGTLLSPLRVNRAYSVINPNAGDFQVSWWQTQSAITLSGSQSGTHSWHHREINLQVTGDTNPINWFVESEIECSRVA